MKMRSMLAALGAALTLAVGLATPASATHQVGYQECLAKHVFFEFFRNNSATDKYCYAGENPQGENTVVVNLNNVTWFHAGSNRAYVEYSDRHGNVLDAFIFPGFDDGCDYCTVRTITIF